MNKLLTASFLAALMSLTLPAAQAGETKFGGVAPASAGHSQNKHYRNYDRYRYDRGTHRSYRTNRSYSRYRYRPSQNYVYRPLPAPRRYAYRDHYHRYHYHPYYRGNGVRISPYGVTIFLDLDD